MKMLGLELSTATGSLAVGEEGRIIHQQSWQAGRHQQCSLFLDIQALVSRQDWDWGQLDGLAVGVGPGSFSGLRMAVAAVRGLALPDAKRVVAVSSAAALAGEIFRETGFNRVVVLGDARRNEVWAGLFLNENGVAVRQGDWVVADPAKLPEFMVSESATWVSPDYERLAGVLEKVCPPGSRLLTRSRIPTAAMVVAEADRRCRAGMPSEPLAPIYLHPAVAVPPRFKE